MKLTTIIAILALANGANGICFSWKCLFGDSETNETVPINKVPLAEKVPAVEKNFEKEKNSAFEKNDEYDDDDDHETKSKQMFILKQKLKFYEAKENERQAGYNELNEKPSNRGRAKSDSVKSANPEIERNQAQRNPIMRALIDLISVIAYEITRPFIQMWQDYVVELIIISIVVASVTLIVTRLLRGRPSSVEMAVRPEAERRPFLSRIVQTLRSYAQRKKRNYLDRDPSLNAAKNKPVTYRRGMDIKVWLVKMETHLKDYDESKWSEIAITYIDDECLQAIKVDEVLAAEKSYAELKA